MHQSINEKTVEALEQFYTVDLEEVSELDEWGNAAAFDKAYEEAIEKIGEPLDVFISEEENYLVFIPANEDSEKEEQTEDS